mgnify:CR=1 FL=1
MLESIKKYSTFCRFKIVKMLYFFKYFNRNKLLNICWGRRSIMKNLFSIGELSKLFDISIRTLRYYDEIGLLKPEFINNETNYRYYSTKQFERLNTIKYLRALDMPIVQIISFFENKDVDKMIQILDEQKKTVISMKKELELIEKKIENRLNQLIDANNTEYNKINIKHIKKREIIVIRKDISIFEDLEHPIRDLEKISSLKAPIFLGKIGVSISADKIKKDIYEEFSSIFIILEEEDFYKGKVETLEESLYAFTVKPTEIKIPKRYKPI